MTRKRRTPKPIIEPRLKGMLVRIPASNGGPAEETLSSWQQVGMVAGKLWTVYDEHGSPEQKNRWRTTPMILVSERALSLSTRAQERAFRQAWLDGNLTIIDHYRFGWDMVLMLVIGLTSMAGGILSLGLPLFLHLKSPLSVPVEPFYQTIIWLVSLLMALMLLAIGGAAVPPAIRSLRHGGIVQSRIDSEGVWVQWRNGTQLSAQWTGIREIHLGGNLLTRLRFDNGTDLWIGQMEWRTQAALRAIKTLLFPGEKAQAKRAAKRSLIRIGSYVLLSAALLAVLAHLAPKDLPISRNDWLLAPMLIVVAAGIALFTYLALRIEKALAPGRKRRQRERRRH